MQRYKSGYCYTLEKNFSFPISVQNFLKKILWND